MRRIPFFSSASSASARSVTASRNPAIDGSSPSPPNDVGALVLARRREELVQVLAARLVLRVEGVLVELREARLLERERHDGRRAVPVGRRRSRARRVDEVPELVSAFFARSVMPVGQLVERREERHALLDRVRLERLQRRRAHAPRRHVHDAAEGHVVGRVPREAQVREERP